MPEKNVNQRLIVIAVVVLVGAYFLYSQKLRPGLDIAGGASLIFEIDTTGAGSDPTLAERVKTLLQKRVDPKGVYNLVWRVHGRNRIEVQMPLPPKDATARRDAYAAIEEQLFDLKLERRPLEEALRQTGPEREADLRKLARRNADAAIAALEGENVELTAGQVEERREAINRAVAARQDLLLKAAERYDEWQAARAALEAGPPATQPTAGPTSEPTEGAPTEPTTSPTTAPTTGPSTGPTVAPVTQESLELAERDARELLEDAVEAVLTSNLNRRRFQEVVELELTSQVRRNSLRHIKQQHPDLADKIDEVLAEHAKWRSGRRFLDGPADLKRLLRGAGKLEFRILAEPSPENVTKYDRLRKQLQEGRPRLPGDAEGWFKIDNPIQFFNFDSPAQLQDFDYKRDDRYVVEKLGEDYYVLAKTSPTQGLLADPSQRRWELKRARPYDDEHGRPCVLFTLDVVGGQLFYALTSKNIGKPLCILVDDVAYSAPNIQSAIRAEGQITGEFSQEKIRYLVQTMEGGTLPARLKDTPLSERTVGSSLGEENRDSAVRAGLIGACAVVVVMLGYYLLCGLIANVALTMNVLLVLSALAMLGARITLDGIAGIILAVGMAVDANVLIYERIREEKARGTSLRMMIKNGYDKALSTIFDSNITTLLVCVIIYYAGSEEVKGFGLTLGWGIVLNLFTSVFVTRTLFTVLLKYNLISDLKMMKLIGVPSVNWYAKRRFFVPLSLIIVIGGMSLLVLRGAKNLFDVEFLGGVAAEIELKQAGLSDRDISERLARVGATIAADAERLEQASVAPVPGETNVFTVRTEGIDGELLAAMLTEPLEGENLLQRGAEPQVAGDHISVYVADEVTQEKLTAKIHSLAATLGDDGDNLGQASVNAVLEVGGVAQRGLLWNVTTTVTNMRLVEHALATALGDDMRVQREIKYVLRGDGDRPYAIRGDDRLLSDVVPDLPPDVNADLTNYLGGAVIQLDQIDPPQSVQAVRVRLDNIRFQPDFEEVPRRDFEVIGIAQADTAGGSGNPLYTGIAVVTVDPDIRFSDDPEKWFTEFAQPEAQLIKTALSKEQTLRKVMQFKPQIAAQATRQASVALVLSWATIIGYVWIRFGRPVYGVAGVTALIHDTLIALAFVGFSGWLGGTDHPIGNALLISDFKIDMTIVAAMLTIIGYSINDTIVVFDRIRETRGRLGLVTPEIINASINQTLSRTLMTSMTTFLILLIMYIFGGSSIRGFNYCMMIGVITGSYSSIAIASPLLMARFGGRMAPARAG